MLLVTTFSFLEDLYPLARTRSKFRVLLPTNGVLRDRTHHSRRQKPNPGRSLPGFRYDRAVLRRDREFWRRIRGRASPLELSWRGRGCGGGDGDDEGGGDDLWDGKRAYWNWV